MNNKPTEERYYPNGNIELQEWWENDKLHRPNDLPAGIRYYPDGTICYQEWWENGKHHRLNGLPAYIYYYENGNIEYQEWWENDKRLSDKEVLHRQYQFLNKIIESINKEGIIYIKL